MSGLRLCACKVSALEMTWRVIFKPIGDSKAVPKNLTLFETPYFQLVQALKPFFSSSPCSKAILKFPTQSLGSSGGLVLSGFFLPTTRQIPPAHFHWQNQALIPPMKGGVLQLAALSDMVNAASCDLPFEAPPLHWQNQALIPPMEGGGAMPIKDTRTTPRIAVPPWEWRYPPR